MVLSAGRSSVDCFPFTRGASEQTHRQCCITTDPQLFHGAEQWVRRSRVEFEGSAASAARQRERSEQGKKGGNARTKRAARKQEAEVWGVVHQPARRARRADGGHQKKRVIVDGHTQASSPCTAPAAVQATLPEIDSPILHRVVIHCLGAVPARRCADATRARTIK